MRKPPPIERQLLSVFKGKLVITSRTVSFLCLYFPKINGMDWGFYSVHMEEYPFTFGFKFVVAIVFAHQQLPPCSGRGERFGVSENKLLQAIISMFK